MVPRPPPYSSPYSSQPSPLKNDNHYHATLLNRTLKTLLSTLQGNIHQLRREDLHFHSRPHLASPSAVSHLRRTRAQWKADLIGRAEAAILLGEDILEDIRRAERESERRYEREKRTGLREGWIVIAGKGREIQGEGWVRGSGPGMAGMGTGEEGREVEGVLEDLRGFRRRVGRWMPMSFWDVDMEEGFSGRGQRERGVKRASFAADPVVSVRDDYDYDGYGGSRRADRYDDDNGDVLEEEKRAAQRAWAARMEREGREGMRAMETFYPPEGKIRLEEIVYWPRGEDDFD
jgi:hypothetical protein